MHYYLVDTIGDGSRHNPFRPNLSEGFLYACAYVGSYFLVGTNQILNETEVTDLQSVCELYGLVYDDILTWSVGEVM